MPTQRDLEGYQPSPYPISNLPRVRCSKPRPKVSSADVPPTPLRRNCSGGSSDDGGGKRSSSSAGTRAPPEDNPRRHFESLSLMHGAGEAPNLVPRRKVGQDVLPKTNMIEIIDDDVDRSRPPTRPRDTKAQLICTTCHTHEARYTCPKCNAPYCSAACYRVHDGGSSRDGAHACTESFYKHRVLSHCNAKERGDGGKSKLGGVLQRLHRDVDRNLDQLERKEESVSRLLKDGDAGRVQLDIKDGASSLESPSSVLRMDTKGGGAMSDEDLCELAEYVMRMEDEKCDDEEHGNHDMLESIPPHLLRAFERELASATQAAEATIPARSSTEDAKVLEDTWAPFLGDDDTVGCPATRQESQHGESQEAKSSKERAALWWLPNAGEVDESQALDARILALSPLPKLRTSNPAAKQSPSLSYNIAEVLYAASFVARVKCSVSSASSTISGHTPKKDDVDGAALLLSQSRVLANDARYTNVREVMIACSERLTENKTLLPRQQGDALSWDVLALDVATLSYHRRYVLRMLFEASDACKAGVALVKRQLKKGVAERSKEREDMKRQYQLAAKKLDYFLSWCSGTWSLEVGRAVGEEARAFVADWKPADLPEESPVEKFIRGTHTSADASSSEVLAGGMLTIGGDEHPSPFRVEDQLVSISTVRRETPTLCCEK